MSTSITRGLDSPCGVSLQALLRALDALLPSERATVRWTRAPLFDALEGLLAEPPTAESIGKATVEVYRALEPAWPLVWPHIHDLTYAAVTRGEMELHALQAALSDDLAAEALEWAHRALVEFNLLFIEQFDAEAAREALDAMPRSAVDAELQAGEAGGINRAQTLVFAIERAVAQQVRVPWLDDLAFAAFIEAGKGVDALAGMGVFVAPQPWGSAKERGVRVTRAAAALRSLLTEEDREVLGLHRHAGGSR